MDMNFSCLRSRFAVPTGDGWSFTDNDKDVLTKIFICEYDYRSKILVAPPNTPTRNSVICEMYTHVFELMSGADAFLAYTGVAELEDRSRDALGVLELCGNGRVLEIGVGAGAMARSLVEQGAKS